MRVGHAREERYAHGAEATTLELAFGFSYARELSSSRSSLIMRRTSLKEKKKCSTRFNLSCTIAAIRVKKQCHDAFYHLWIIKPVLQQIDRVVAGCGNLLQEVKIVVLLFATKFVHVVRCTGPLQTFFRSERRNSPVWLDSRVIVSNQKSVHAQLATTGFAVKTVRFETGW